MFQIRRIARFARVSCERKAKSIAANKPRATSWIISRRNHDQAPLQEQEDDFLRNEEYDELASRYLGITDGGHDACVIQPYVKWGPKKKTNTTPELQLQEAVTLVKTLSNWTVVDQLCMPLMSLEKKKLLGLGNLESLRERVRRSERITAVFVSTNLLKPVQIQELESVLGVPVFDRYAIVVQIFRAHARTREAQLQVAIAEIPYLWSKINLIRDNRGGQINLIESRRKLLQVREAKLKNALKKLREHRELLRSKRRTNNVPTIAVVGYTNAGKTSLIRALTGDESLQPRNQLFATLDVTVHQGYLPSRLKCLFVDTIGFIQDVPSTLIEPFVATLEDAVYADVILHVADASHPDKQAQIEHVNATLKGLIKDRPVINVANKLDCVTEGEPLSDMLHVSATQLTGIDVLREKIEEELLGVTGRSVVRVRVQAGSNAIAWLYKETTVIGVAADPKNPQYMLMDVVATEAEMSMFRQFLKR